MAGAWPILAAVDTTRSVIRAVHVTGLGKGKPARLPFAFSRSPQRSIAFYPLPFIVFAALLSAGKQGMW